MSEAWQTISRLRFAEHRDHRHARTPKDVAGKWSFDGRAMERTTEIPRAVQAEKRTPEVLGASCYGDEESGRK